MVATRSRSAMAVTPRGSVRRACGRAGRGAHAGGARPRPTSASGVSPTSQASAVARRRARGPRGRRRVGLGGADLGRGDRAVEARRGRCARAPRAATRPSWRRRRAAAPRARAARQGGHDVGERREDERATAACVDASTRHAAAAGRRRAAQRVAQLERSGVDARPCARGRRRSPRASRAPPRPAGRRARRPAAAPAAPAARACRGSRAECALRHGRPCGDADAVGRGGASRSASRIARRHRAARSPFAPPPACDLPPEADTRLRLVERLLYALDPRRRHRDRAVEVRRGARRSAARC